MMWLYHYSWWWTLDLFPVFGTNIMSTAFTGPIVQVSWKVYACIFLSMYLGVDWQDHRVLSDSGNWFPRQLNQFTLPGHYVRLLVAPHIYQHLVLCTVRVLTLCQSGGCGFICVSLMSVEGEHFLCVYWPFGFPFWQSESLAFATCMSGYSLSLRFFWG